MAIIDRIKTTGALGNLYFQPSITNGLHGLFQPRKSDVEAVKNRAPNGIDGTIGGIPTYTLWGAVLGPNGYIDTAIPETKSYTVITIARKASVTGGVMMVSSRGSGSPTTTPYISVLMRGVSEGVMARLQVESKTTPTTSTSTLTFGYDFPPDDDGFDFFAATVQDGAPAVLNTMMPANPVGVFGGNPRAATMAGPRDEPVETLRLGWIKATGSSLYPGSTEYSLFMIYDRALSPLEMRALYAEAKAYFAPRGVAF